MYDVDELEVFCHFYTYFFLSPDIISSLSGHLIAPKYQMEDLNNCAKYFITNLK